MADTAEGSTYPLIDDLLSRGHECSFSQVMRIARRHFGPGGPQETPGVPWQDRVQVRPDLSLAFPSADVVRVERAGKDGADLLVTTTFLGLYGSSSPLPTHYTEDLLDEAADGSSASRDFLDILHQRIYQLHFEGWSKYKIFVRMAEENNLQDWERLFCLVGLGEQELRNSIPEAKSLLRYVGLFSQFSRSAMGLETLLRDALGVERLEVEPCVLRRVSIPEDQRTRLGVANCCLGVDTVLGTEMQDRMGKFRIHIGPLSKKDFDSFLPGTPRHERLAGLIRLYIADPLEYDMNLIMAAGEARPLILGDPDGPRLGWNSWCFAGDTLGEVNSILPIMHPAARTPAPAADDLGAEPETEGPSTLTEHYQEELAKLRDLAAKYAKDHPELASLVTGNPADPSVERLFEWAALISAHLQLRLNDDFPEVIHELTEALHPWDLRPIPATTIVAFTPKAAQAQPLPVAAGAEILSIPVQGTKCSFRTCFDVTVHPLTLLSASFSHPPGKPPSIKLQCVLKGMVLSGWQADSLRLFLGDEAGGACDLYLLLLRNLKRIVITAPDSGASIELAPGSLKPAGFAANENMLADDRAFLPGHQILQEYFLFQDKFLFLDLTGLCACRALGDGSLLEIDFELIAHPLVKPQVNEKSFVLYATPAINLFAHKARPIAVENNGIPQKVRPVGSNPENYEIYSVDRITDFGVDTAEIKPSFQQSLLAKLLGADHPCDVTKRRALLGEGFDVLLSLPQRQGEEHSVIKKLDVDLTCTNGKLPGRLNLGDLSIPAWTVPESVDVANIKSIVSSIYPDSGMNRQWKLLGGFSLNRPSLDLAVNLRAILRLYISKKNQHQATVKANLQRVEAIERIDAKPTDRLIKRGMYRGYEIRIKLRGANFAGPGDLYLFGSVLERFLAGFVTENCFIRLFVQEIAAGYEFEWPARLGDKPSM